MKNFIVAAIAAATIALTAAPAVAQSGVQVGRLSCDVAGGVGFLIGSSKDATCTFTTKNGATETYTGNISKLGFDVGVTGQTRLEWLVFAAGPVAPRALAGTYVGGAGEATLGVGMGANWLVGGFGNSISLQPWSIQASTGVSLTWALAGLRLH